MVSFTKVAQKRTICEVIREVHDLIDQDNEEIVGKLQEMSVMAKKMDAKLKEYKANWQDSFYKVNTNIEEKYRIRA